MYRIVQDAKSPSEKKGKWESLTSEDKSLCTCHNSQTCHAIAMPCGLLKAIYGMNHMESCYMSLHIYEDLVHFDAGLVDFVTIPL